MKTNTIRNYSMSSVNSSDIYMDPYSKVKHSISQINSGVCSIIDNQNEIESCSSFSKINSKGKEGGVDVNYSTAENNSQLSSNYKKRRLVRKMNNSVVITGNETNIMMSSINESSIAIKEDKFNNSLINININTDDSSIIIKENSDFPSEQKLHKLVKQMKRTNSNSNWSKNLNKSKISNFVSQSDSLIDFKTDDLTSNIPQIEIKNHNQYSNFELSKILFNIIHSNNGLSNTIVKLPPRYISFPYLILNNNIHIKGSPGTLVEINNGIIIISSNSKGNDNDNDNDISKVSLSECSFVFNLELNSFQEKMKHDEILNFYVEVNNEGKYYISFVHILPNTNLEINDCDFRAIVHENENIINYEDDINRFVYETLFYIPESVSLLKTTRITLQSTICSNFYTIIDAYNADEILIHNCHFSDTISTAVYLENIRSLLFTNSTIVNTFTGMEICNKQKKGLSTVVITYSEFNGNKNYGLKISSDFSIDIKYEIEIKKNIFRYNSNSIFISKINSQKINLCENEIKNNFECGVQIREINDVVSIEKERNEEIFYKLITTDDKTKIKNSEENEYGIVILRNIIKENKNKIGLQMENINNMKIQLDDNKIHTNLIGVKMENISNCLIVAKYNHINENLESGISFLNFNSNVKVLLNNFKIMKNILNGILTLNNNTSELITNCPHIYIKNCEISHNKKCGIRSTNFNLSIDNSTLQNNNNWAIELPIESNRQLLKLINYEIISLNSLITNPIGGSWGVIENKKSICANTNCFLL